MIHRGFTLIETMVAVTILTLATVGPLYTASRATIAAAISRDQLIASYLAQEGIEYARLLRDNAYLAAYKSNPKSAWTNFKSDYEGEDKIHPPAIPAGNSTAFTRVVKASEVSLNDEKITSTVTWSFHGVPYSITITDHLTPWQ